MGLLNWLRKKTLHLSVRTPAMKTLVEEKLIRGPVTSVQLGDHLEVVFTTVRGEVLGASAFDELGLSTDEAIDLGTRALSSTFEGFEAGDGFVECTAPGAEGVLTVAATALNGVVRGRPVVAVPRIGAFAAAGEDDAAALAKLIDFVEATDEEKDLALSSRLFVFDGGVPVPWFPEVTHPLCGRVRELDAKARRAEALLWHASKSDLPAMLQLDATEDGLIAVWLARSEGDVVLPQVDRIVFYEDENTMHEVDMRLFVSVFPSGFADVEGKGRLARLARSSFPTRYQREFLERLDANAEGFRSVPTAEILAAWDSGMLVHVRASDGNLVVLTTDGRHGTVSVDDLQGRQRLLPEEDRLRLALELMLASPDQIADATVGLFVDELAGAGLRTN